MVGAVLDGIRTHHSGSASDPDAAARIADLVADLVTGPSIVVNGPSQLVRSRPADACGMTQVDLQHHPLTASAALVWNGDLPRPLQQMLFDAAESLSAAPSLAGLIPR